MSSVWRYQASRLYGTAHSKGTSTGENGRAWKRQVMKNYCRRYPLTAILLSLFAALLTTGNRYCRCSAFDVQKSSSISNGGDPHKFLAVSRLRFASRSRRSRGLDIALAMRGGGLPRGKLSADKKQVSGEAAALSSCAVGGKFRDAVFPIYGSREVGKFLALAGIQFFIIFVLTLTRDLKDTLIITSCGAEAISFLKVYGVLPAATVFMLVYSKVSTLLDKRALFYATALPFFAFYLFFKMVMYPARDLLHPSREIAMLTGLPEGMTYVVKLYRNWTFALFYVVSELYSSVSIGVLFWQFANDIVPVKQAKRFYPLFGQLSSLAPVIAGLCVVRFTNVGRSPAAGGCDKRDMMTDGLLNFVLTLVMGAGVAIFSLYEVTTALSGREQREIEAAAGGGASAAEAKRDAKGKKPKLGLAESFRVLSRSKYLGFLATLVLGYGLCINMTEVMWKSMVKKQYPEAVDYARFMGKYSSTLGMATFVVIFFGSNLIKHLGWRAGALTTPLMMAVLAAPLFGVVIASKGEAAGSSLAFAVMVGTVQSILSKATKYALFDPTTQMAYIPLDEESKVKGKAAIDGLGSRLGKSGASFLQQGLVLAFGNILRAAPFVAVIFYAALGSWTYGAVRLAEMFDAKTKEQERASSTSRRKGGAGGGHVKASSSNEEGMALRLRSRTPKKAK